MKKPDVWIARLVIAIIAVAMLADAANAGVSLDVRVLLGVFLLGAIVGGI